MAEEGNSWDMVNDNDLWEDKDVDSDQGDYVLVRQEDIVEGIACFMATYLLSLKQTKVCYLHMFLFSSWLYTIPFFIIIIFASLTHYVIHCDVI